MHRHTFHVICQCGLAVLFHHCRSLAPLSKQPLSIYLPIQSGRSIPCCCRLLRVIKQDIPLLTLSIVFATAPTIIIVGIVDSVLAIATSWLLVSTRKDACDCRQRRFSQAPRRKGHHGVCSAPSCHRHSHPEQHRGTTIQWRNVLCTPIWSQIQTRIPTAPSSVSSPRQPRTSDEASFFTTTFPHTPD